MGWVFFHTADHTATYVAHSALPNAEREGKRESQTIGTNILGFALTSSEAAVCFLQQPAAHKERAAYRFHR